MGGRSHVKDVGPQSTDPSVRKLITEINRRRMPWSEFYALSGVPMNTVLGWRSGRREPKIKQLRRAFNALGFDLVVTPLEKQDG